MVDNVRKSEKNNVQYNLWTTIVSSFWGGMGQKLALAPFGNLKMRSQIHRTNFIELLTKMKKVEVESKTGIVATRAWIFGLWKGTLLSTLKTTAYTTIYQSIYKLHLYSPWRLELQEMITSTTNNSIIGKNVSVGLLSWGAGTIGTIGVFPVDLIRSRLVNRIEPTRLTGVKFQERPTVQIAKEVFHGSWFKGLGATMISTSPFNFLNGMLYYGFRYELNIHSAASGGLAAALSAIMTHNLDTITQRVKNSPNHVGGFRSMIQYINNTQGYTNADLKEGYQFNNQGRLVNTKTQAEFGGFVLHKNALLSHLPVESKAKRLLKTYYAGLGPNIAKSASTYALRWFIGEYIDTKLKKR